MPLNYTPVSETSTPHTHTADMSQAIKLLWLLLLIPMAGCAGNKRYQELQENKQRYPGFQFPDRAPYEGPWTD